MEEAIMNGWKNAAVSLAAGMLGALLMMSGPGAAQRVKAKPARIAAVIEAREFHLVDSKGAVRGVWHADDDGTVALSLSGQEVAKAILTVTGEGVAALTLGNGPDNRIGLMTVKHDRPAILLWGASGTIAIGTSDTGIPGLEARDKAGKVLFQSSH